MSGIRIEGSVSGNVGEVDVNNNQLVNLPTVINHAGYVAVVNEIDSGSVTGAPLRRIPYVSHNFRIRTGLDTTIFDYFFTAAAQDTGIWKTAFTVMTATQPGGGFLLLNAAGTSTASGNYVYMSTWRPFALEARGGLHLRFDAEMTVAPLANQVVEIGLFLPVAGTAPADGVYFRLTSAGVQGIINYNGTETSTGITTASPPYGITNTYAMEVFADGVEFYLNNVLQAFLLTPGGNSEPFVSVSLPITITQRNSGVVSGSPQMQFKVGSCHIDFLEIQTAMPYSHQQAAEGLTGQQAPQGSATMGAATFYAQNLAAGAGIALSQSLANPGVGLGGQFSGLPTLTVPDDGIICSYANPTGSVTYPSRILMITGVKIQGMVTTILTGGPVYYVYALNFGHTTVSLATAETASFATGTTKKPRSVVLGYETYAATAAVGTLGSTNGVYMAFNSPIAVNPLEFVAISAKNLGTVTSGGVITWLVTYDAYWI